MNIWWYLVGLGAALSLTWVIALLIAAGHADDFLETTAPEPPEDDPASRLAEWRRYGGRRP